MIIHDPDQLRTMEEAFAARDRSQDGHFVVGVTTTGIYCRPSCPARRPRPENVKFFADNGDAEASGLRPCKRCKPDEVSRDAEAVKKAVLAIQTSETRVALNELGVLTGYSPAHFQRVFKKATGLSPSSYSRALREERVRDALSGSGNVSAAIYQAGFEAPSRFYDAMKGKLGMTPSVWSKGGAGVTLSWAVVQTTLGAMLVAATDKGVCRLSFNEDREDLAAIFPKADLAEGGPEFAALLAQVVSEVETPGTGGDIPLDVRGTVFQEAVWQELRKIPCGETRSYAQIAAAAGHPKAVRAAGSANGANSVAVLIPCHRVVRTDGSIGGYAYGATIKEALLKRERG